MAVTVVERVKLPLAMYCFMIWKVSLSRTTTPSPTSSKATTSQKPIRPTWLRRLFHHRVAAEVGAPSRVAYGENSLKV